MKTFLIIQTKKYKRFNGHFRIYKTHPDEQRINRPEIYIVFPRFCFLVVPCLRAINFWDLLINNCITFKILDLVDYKFDITRKVFSDVSIFWLCDLLISLFRFSRKFWQYSSYKGGPLKSDIRKSLSRCCVSCCFNYRFVNSCYWPRAWQEINSTLLRLTFSYFLMRLIKQH